MQRFVHLSNTVMITESYSEGEDSLWAGMIYAYVTYFDFRSDRWGHFILWGFWVVKEPCTEDDTDVQVVLGAVVSTGSLWLWYACSQVCARHGWLSQTPEPRQERRCRTSACAQGFQSAKVPQGRFHPLPGALIFLSLTLYVFIVTICACIIEFYSYLNNNLIEIHKAVTLPNYSVGITCWINRKIIRLSSG